MNSKKINLENIKNPDFVKSLNYKELKTLSDDVRKYLLDTTSKNGGHIASNLGVVEATISLLRSFDFSKDKIIFDVGHQSYTYKLLTGRSLKTLRQKGGISGYQKINESEYDHFEAGHSSTSLSAAEGMAIARDLNKDNYNVVAFIGDSSIANGLSLEALNSIAATHHKVIIVINDNNMSISKPVGSLSNLFRKFSTSLIYSKSKNAYIKFFGLTRFGRWILRQSAKVKNWFKRKLLNVNIFDALGFSCIGIVDGHSIKDLDKAFKLAKRIKKSVVIHIKTVKGKGYPYAEDDDCGEWHGVSEFDVATGAKKSSSAQTWSDVYGALLDDSMNQNNKVVTIVPATEHGSSLDSLFKKYPERTFDVGIAEEHSVTMAAGLSASSYHPVISMYSTFLQRSYDEISHDLCRMNLPSTILVDRCGLVGRDGETHQGIYDEAFLYTMPNITITMGVNSADSKVLLAESLNKHGPFVIRYPREYANIQDNIVDIAYGEWRKECSGKNIAIVSVGPVTDSLKALIQNNNLNVTLYSAIYLKPYNDSYIDELAKYSKVIIYNAYATEEGFAKDLSSKLMLKKYNGELIIKTIPTKFVPHGSINEQREWYGLNPEDIIKLI